MSSLKQSDQTTMEQFAGMEQKIGDRAVCSMCGEWIEFVGPHWRHAYLPPGVQPRHPAWPREPAPEPEIKLTDEQAKRLLAEIYSTPEPIVPLSDDEVAEIEAAYDGRKIDPERDTRQRAALEEMRREYFDDLDIARPPFCDNEACGLPATTTGTDGQPLCAECAADAPEDANSYSVGAVPPARRQPATIHIGDSPDEPLSTWLPPSIRLEAKTSPRIAADRLREMYTAEWIADLQVCLTHMETNNDA